MNNDELNNQIPNSNSQSHNDEVLKDFGEVLQESNNIDNTSQSTVFSPSVTPPTVAPPVITPPSVDGNNTINTTDEDNRILKPITPQVEVLSDTPKVEEVLNTETLTSNEPLQQTINETKYQQDVDNNEKEKEITTEVEKVKSEYKEPSKFKLFLVILLFISFFGIIINLPKITEYIETVKEQKEVDVDEVEIIDGILSCDLDTNNDKFDLIYTYEFHFKNNRLNSLNFADTIKGDRTLDSADLNTIYNNCKSLSSELDTVDGASISCDLFEGTVTRSQTLDYNSIDAEKIEELYTKYSVDLPEYELNQNINDIERDMKAKGYTCERTSDK